MLKVNRSADIKMNRINTLQKYYQTRHEWSFDYVSNGNGKCDIPEVKMYSSVVKRSSRFGVKFDIICYLSKEGTCHVILSKIPDPSVRATIIIRCIKPPKSVRKTVDCWTDSCSLRIDLGSTLENLLYDSAPSVVAFQCIVIWLDIFAEKPERTYLKQQIINFENFLAAPDLSDMTIVIDKNEIPVHKIILAAYSPVFLAMFKTDMTETVDKRIIITDIKIDIMKKVIEFMYTCSLDTTLDFPDLLSVLEVADKYEIMNLKKKCENWLTKDIEIDNVLKILERASLYGVPQLMQKLISFMVENKSEIVVLEDFTDLYHRKPELFFEFIIRSIA